MSTLLLGERLFEKRAFARETDFERAIEEVSRVLFGRGRIYLDVKHRIGGHCWKKNNPDGYLIDLLSDRNPQLYVIEIEIAGYDPLRHIGVQLLECSFAFKQSKRRVKDILFEELSKDEAGMGLCRDYAARNGYGGVDHLLETMLFDGEYRALVIIDDAADELETALRRKLDFPIEVVELSAFESGDGERLYQFTPFLEDVVESVRTAGEQKAEIDIAEVDTVVVPARESAFREAFVGEDCWYNVRIHSSMLNQIRYCAAYRTVPVSAITHVAPVKSIEPYQDGGRVKILFAEPATEIKPIRLVKGGRVKAPQSLCYTSYARMMSADNLDDALA